MCEAGASSFASMGQLVSALASHWRSARCLAGRAGQRGARRVAVQFARKLNGNWCMQGVLLVFLAFSASSWLPSLPRLPWLPEL